MATLRKTKANIKAVPSWITIGTPSGTNDGESTIQVKAYTGRKDRSATVTAQTSGGATDTSTVNQSGKPAHITIATKTYSIGATGGSVEITGTSNVASLALVGSTRISGAVYKLTVNEVADKSWNGSNDTQVDGDPGASADYSFKLSITYPANNTESAKKDVFAVKTAEGNVTSGDITITQTAGVRTYALPVITSFTYQTDVPAAGGSITPKVSFTQTWGWNGSTTGGGTVTSGGTWAYTGAGVDPVTGAVSGSNLGTTVKERTLLATASATVTANGRASAAQEAKAYQAANVATYNDVVIVAGTVDDIPASGGQVSEAKGMSASQNITFTSGASRQGEVFIFYGSPVKASSLTTTVKARTQVGTLQATATGEGVDTTSTHDYPVYQAANQITKYGEIVHKLTTPKNVPAAGGSFDLEELAAATQQLTYTSGATSQNSDIDVVVTQVVAQTGFSLKGVTVTVTENTLAAARNGYEVKVDFTGLNEKTATQNVVFNQQGVNSQIVLTPETLEFEATGGTQTINIESNDSWTIS